MWSFCPSDDFQWNIGNFSVISLNALHYLCRYVLFCTGTYRSWLLESLWVIFGVIRTLIPTYEFLISNCRACASCGSPKRRGSSGQPLPKADYTYTHHKVHTTNMCLKNKNCSYYFLSDECFQKLLFLDKMYCFLKTLGRNMWLYIYYFLSRITVGRGVSFRRTRWVF